MKQEPPPTLRQLVLDSIAIVLLAIAGLILFIGIALI